MGFTIPNLADATFPIQSKVFATDLLILAAGDAGTGVISGCAVTAQGSPDLTVAVAAGTVLIDGVSVTVAGGNSSSMTADGSNPRFYLIEITTAGAIALNAGTAATNPVPPTPTSSRAVLATVYLEAADTTVASNQIIDKRVTSLNNFVSTGLSSGQKLILTPTTQNLTFSVGLSSDTLTSTAAKHAITSTTAGGGAVVTTPTIADGTDGQTMLLVNRDTADSITLIDQQSLAGTGLNLGGPQLALAPSQSVLLSYDSTVDGWVAAGATVPNSRSLIGPWYQENVAANQSAVALNIFNGGGGTNRAEFIAVRPGSITGISIFSNAARTNGTCTVDVTINGTVTGLTAVLNAINTTVSTASEAPLSYIYSSGQRIGVKITTSGTWAPTTADITVCVEITG